MKHKKLIIGIIVIGLLITGTVIAQSGFWKIVGSSTLGTVVNSWGVDLKSGNLITTGTITAEQLTSTDDATITDLLSAARGTFISTSTTADILNLKGITLIGSVSFSGELDDMTTGGTYTGTVNTSFYVEIDEASDPDSFKWSNDGGSTFENTEVTITGSAQTLENGVTIIFGATTGHTLGDNWAFTATAYTGTPFDIQNPAGTSQFKVDAKGNITLTGTETAADITIDQFDSAYTYTGDVTAFQASNILARHITLTTGGGMIDANGSIDATALRILSTGNAGTTGNTIKRGLFVETKGTADTNTGVRIDVSGATTNNAISVTAGDIFFIDNIVQYYGTVKDASISFDGDSWNFANNVTQNADFIFTGKDDAVTKTTTWDLSENTWNFGDSLLTTTGTITGVNVTSAENPGHTHTGGSLSGIDISDDTNLAGGSGITLNDDTLDLDINSLAVATIVSGDFVPFWDITATATNKKTTFANFEAALTHNNLISGTIASHDTSATGAELDTLTDNSIANTLHRHSELVASDGTPDPALSVDATGNFNFQAGNLTTTGNVGFGTASDTFALTLSKSNTAILKGVNTGASGSGGGAGIQWFTDDGAATASGDRLGFFTMGGANDSASTLVNPTAITSFAVENWSAGNHGSELRFETTPIGSGSRRPVLYLKENGRIGNVGASAPRGIGHFTGSNPARFIIQENTGSSSTTSGVYFKNTSNTADNFIKGAVIFEDTGILNARGRLHLAVDIVSDSGNVDATDAKLTIQSDGNIELPLDNQKLFFGAVQDASIEFDGDSMNLVANATTAGNTMNFTAASYNFNEGAANTDIPVNFTATTNSGLFTWMEDEDYFLFADDISLPDNEKIRLGTTVTDLEIYSDGTNGVVNVTGAFDIANSVAGTAGLTRIFTADGDGTDDNILRIYGVGTQADQTASEFFQVGFAGDTDTFEFSSLKTGGGTLRDIFFFTEGNSQMKFIASDGSLQLGDTGATSLYMNIEADADTYWVGAGTGLPYGEIHQADGSTFAVTMTTQNVWVEVDAATTNISATELNLCTFPDDHYILCLKAGKYLITYSMTGEINSVAGGDQHIESGIMVNGSIQTDKGLGHEQYAATGKEKNLQGHSIINISANDQISLAIKNTASAGKILTIDHLNITVTQLGG